MVSLLEISKYEHLGQLEGRCRRAGRFSSGPTLTLMDMRQTCIYDRNNSFPTQLYTLSNFFCSGHHWKCPQHSKQHTTLHFFYSLILDPRLTPSGGPKHLHPCPRTLKNYPASNLSPYHTIFKPILYHCTYEHHPISA
jgi:hypothetical protein